MRMTKANIPYHGLSEVAAAAGVPYCRGIVNGSYCGDPQTSGMDHRRGFVRDGEVHMADRPVTRPVIRAFCLLAADAEEGEVYDQMPPWEARWRRCVTAAAIARNRLRVRIPSSYWNLDRWTVRAQLVHIPTSDPRRSEAMAWARLAGDV